MGEFRKCLLGDLISLYVKSYLFRFSFRVECLSNVALNQGFSHFVSVFYQKKIVMIKFVSGNAHLQDI